MSDERKQLAAQLWDDGKGMTRRAIARQLGVSNSTILRWLNPEYEQRCRNSSNAAKKRNRGRCESCGAPTNACGGPGKASRFCNRCAPAHYMTARRGTFGKRQMRVVEALADGEIKTFTELRQAAGIMDHSPGQMVQMLQRLIAYGKVERVARGRYRKVAS